MKLSFGMIFSIILIIIFIAFAFYAIHKFLELQRTIEIEDFSNKLQQDVDKMWKSPKGSSNESYSLPKRIVRICFTNEDESYNLELLSSEMVIKRTTIEHIDIAEIISEEEPYCILNIDKKVELRLFKDFGEDLVTITRLE